MSYSGFDAASGSKVLRYFIQKIKQIPGFNLLDSIDLFLEHFLHNFTSLKTRVRTSSASTRKLVD